MCRALIVPVILGRTIKPPIRTEDDASRRNRPVDPSLKAIQRSEEQPEPCWVNLKTVPHPNPAHVPPVWPPKRVVPYRCPALSMVNPAEGSYPSSPPVKL